MHIFYFVTSVDDATPTPPSPKPTTVNEEATPLATSKPDGNPTTKDDQVTDGKGKPNPPNLPTPGPVTGDGKIIVSSPWLKSIGCAN